MQQSGDGKNLPYDNDPGWRMYDKGGVKYFPEANPTMYRQRKVKNLAKKANEEATKKVVDSLKNQRKKLQGSFRFD